MDQGLACRRGGRRGYLLSQERASLLKRALPPPAEWRLATALAMLMYFLLTGLMSDGSSPKQDRL